MEIGCQEREMSKGEDAMTPTKLVKFGLITNKKKVFVETFPHSKRERYTDLYLRQPITHKTFKTWPIIFIVSANDSID